MPKSKNREEWVLRSLVGAGATALPAWLAMRARDANRPAPDDLAAAEAADTEWIASGGAARVRAGAERRAAARRD